MAITTHSARITGPVPYRIEGAGKHHIPLGACLVEKVDGRSIDILWGANGRRSASLPVEQIEAAQACGYLVLLD